MRQHYSEMVALPALGVLEYGAVAGCDEAILMPMVIPGAPASVSIDGTLDGVNWVPIDALQTVAMGEGAPIHVPYAGCYKVLRATVSGADATIQWASRWSD